MCSSWRCSTLGICSSQFGSHCSKRKRNQSTDGRISAATRRSRTWIADRHGDKVLTPSWVSGTSPWASAQQRWDVGFAEPEDPRAGPLHAGDQVEQRDQFRSDASGAVVQVDGEPVLEHAAATDAAVVVPALLAATGAGEVAQAAGAVGAPALPRRPDTGEQPLGVAAVTDAVGLAGLGEATRADPALGPGADRDPDPTARVRRGWLVVRDPQRPLAAGAPQSRGVPGGR